jgi:AmmeMemoRadiSam system protein A
MLFTQEDKFILLQIARSSLERIIAGKLERQFPPISQNIKSQHGAFVTLREEGQLRGCIGFIDAKKPLYQVIREAAVKAAKEDPRFYPVTTIELNKINIEISILSELVPLASIEEIEIGKHGLLIISGTVRGLLLPGVAVEMNWNREQFLSNVAMKAGLSADAWKEPETKLFSFTTETFRENGQFRTVI